jgi:RNA polymerase sigma-70 factor, ECF subfamily
MFRAGSEKLWCIASAILRDPAGADDVVQEAAVVAMDKLHEFDPDHPSTSFVAWMGQIVRYTALNEHRRKRRESAKVVRPENPGEFIEGGIDAGRPGGVDTAVATFDSEVQAALSVLDETARACLVMKTVMNLSYAEIAASLAIPEGTAMSHVCRARKTVRDQITAQRERVKGGRP